MLDIFLFWLYTQKYILDVKTYYIHNNIIPGGNRTRRQHTRAQAGWLRAGGGGVAAAARRLRDAHIRRARNIARDWLWVEGWIHVICFIYITATVYIDRRMNGHWGRRVLQVYQVPEGKAWAPSWGHLNVITNYVIMKKPKKT